jgi:hypothetical protein
MNMGMIIDVDLMSINAFNDTINLVNQQSLVYAGVAVDGLARRPIPRHSGGPEEYWH